MTANDDREWLARIGVATAEPETGSDTADDGVPLDDAVAHISSGDDHEDDDSDSDNSFERDDFHGDDGEDDNGLVGADRDVIDLDADPDPNPDADAGDLDHQQRPRRFTPWVAALFGGVALLATVITVAASTLTGRDEPTPAPARSSSAPRPPAPAPPPSTAEPIADGPIPFTASADCGQGSTAAQSVADPQSRTPWICARKVDGQVLTINLGRAYVITAVSIVPGAVNKTSADDQSDPWLQHRVVSRLQWQFNDTDKTIKSQNTGNVHGEAVMAVPNVLASAVTVIIQETSRPPMVAPTTTAAPAPRPGGDILGPILGTPNAPESGPALPGQPAAPDPSDGTFAVSSIKIIGHKVI